MRPAERRSASSSVAPASRAHAALAAAVAAPQPNAWNRASRTRRPRIRRWIRTRSPHDALPDSPTASAAAIAPAPAGDARWRIASGG